MNNRRDFLKQFAITGAGLLIGQHIVSNQTFADKISSNFETVDAWAQVPQILARIKPPKFRNKDFQITKYGAKPDGVTDCTNAISKAIEVCSKSGGGRVVVPAGIFLTGAIHLKSNVNLHVSKGATLKFTKDPKAYLPVVFTRWEGMECMNYSPFIYAYEQTNIGITGEGTLDGQSDQSFWLWHGNKKYGWKDGMPNQKADRAKLYEMMDKGVAVKNRIFGENHYLRPQFVQPYKCKNVLIEGVTVINSPMWEIHPVLCENVTIQNLNINSHGPNNDGCDPESCKDVLIKNCIFDTGDDCIAIKSGRNADGRRINVPTENVIVQDCTMKDGHGGITIGSEISGGVRNVFGLDCKLDSPNLDHALRVKNNASRGGLLENFYFKNITVGQVAHAVITIDFNYEEGAKGGFTPVMRNYVVENLTSGKSEYGVDLQGLDKAPIYNVFIKNTTFDKVEKGNIIRNLQGVKIENFKLNGKMLETLV
ncbi:MAG: glycoside hydrolase family 28 protein [Pyrinomonadaceae bacterium]|nr:glycoside hydrolase family 28 protein [Pyrinomonadaceae bacterium]